MKKFLTITLVTLLAFSAGFLVANYTTEPENMPIGAPVLETDITDNSGVTVLN